MSKFLKMVGHTAVYGRFVVASSVDGGNVRLHVESAGGKPVPGFRSPTISTETFAALEDEWAAGCYARDDARIAMRAMEWLDSGEEWRAEE